MFLEFIGVIKQASFQYTIAHLKIKQFNHRGDYYILVSEYVNEVVTEMVVYVWFDCDRKYFIETRGCLEERKAVLRQRCNQGIEYVDADSQMVDLDIPQQILAQI